MEHDFHYTIELVSQVAVIRFCGRITKQNSYRIERCLLEMQRLKARRIMLSFKDLKSIDQSSYLELTKIQFEARKQFGGILLAECSQELMTQLLSAGIIRPTELSSTLEISIDAMSRTITK